MKEKIEEVTELTEPEELPGVGSVTAEKLRNAGFGDVLSVALTMPNTLAEACELKYSEACKIVHTAKQHIKLNPLETGDVVKERRAKLQRLKIGVKDFDDLLGGGLEPGAITEFYGEFSTGKTQICHQLCVNVQLPVEKGGLEGEAVYV
ncbi:MAG: DNA repair and recombination protein RadA, partial [Candidatus Thermoplasmatota archaeon]